MQMNKYEQPRCMVLCLIEETAILSNDFSIESENQKIDGYYDDSSLDQNWYEWYFESLVSGKNP